MTGVGDMLQRIEDGRTGRVLSGRAIEIAPLLAVSHQPHTALRLPDSIDVSLV
jgi:hypothetical protein